MTSFINYVSQNIGFNLRRSSSKRQPQRPSTPTIRPSLDTSTGIIAVRYSDSDDNSTPSTPLSDGSEKSFIESPVDHGVTRPTLPKRSASRRSTRPFEYERPMTAVAATDRPPIPPKSPYRACRTMVRLQSELAEMSEDHSLNSDAATYTDRTE